MNRSGRHLGMIAAALLLGSTACTASAGSRPPGPVHPPEGSSTAAGSVRQRAFTLVASGDVLPHDSVIRQASQAAHGGGYDFAPMLAGVRPLVSAADLAICHMETVYGARGGPFTGYPNFTSPPEVAKALRATGYDACSTASNHTLDDGSQGIRRTLDALDAAGVRHVGSARSAAESARPALLSAGGATVAQLAYTYGTNGIALPDGQPWAVHLIDVKRIVADARAARRAGADIVVVSMHWGTEWQQAADGRQLALARRLTASRTAGRPDIDLIIGTHAHIPQAYEKVNGTWVIYGMGDQIAGEMVNNQARHDIRGDQGSVGRFTFAPPARRGGRWTVRKAEFVPEFMDTAEGRVVDLPEALRTTPGRADYQRAEDAISAAVLSRGAAGDGLTMGR